MSLVVLIFGLVFLLVGLLSDPAKPGYAGLGIVCVLVAALLEQLREGKDRPPGA